MNNKKGLKVKVMEKNVYVWVVAKYRETIKTPDNEPKGVIWHAPIRLDNKIDLISQIKSYNASKIYLTGSKKEAEELAKFWNECARRNGNYRWE